jgi:hypothetical protein
LSTPDSGWINDRYSPAAVTIGNPLPRTADAKAPFPSELGIITVLVLPLASLGYMATRASLPLTSFFPRKQFSVFVPNVEEKLRVDRKKNSSQGATHDSVFRRVRVVSLDIDSKWLNDYNKCPRCNRSSNLPSHVHPKYLPRVT